METKLICNADYREQAIHASRVDRVVQRILDAKSFSVFPALREIRVRQAPIGLFIVNRTNWAKIALTTGLIILPFFTVF